VDWHTCAINTTRLLRFWISTITNRTHQDQPTTMADNKPDNTHTITNKFHSVFAKSTNFIDENIRIFQVRNLMNNICSMVLPSVGAVVIGTHRCWSRFQQATDHVYSSDWTVREESSSLSPTLNAATRGSPFSRTLLSIATNTSNSRNFHSLNLIPNDNYASRVIISSKLSV